MNAEREEGGDDASTFTSKSEVPLTRFLAGVENYKLQNQTDKMSALEKVLPKIIDSVKCLSNPEINREISGMDVLQALCVELLDEENEMQKNILLENRYLLSPDFEKNILSTMANMCLKAIIKSVKNESGIYGLVVDTSYSRQSSISVRYITNNFEVKERFLGLVGDDSLAIVDFLTKHQLPLENLRSQTCGNDFVSERFNECQVEVKKLQPLAHLTYSNAHITQLMISTVFKDHTFIEAFYCVKQFHNLCTEFGFFKDLFASDDRSHLLTLRPICPEDFRFRSNDMKRILDNYSHILETLRGSDFGTARGSEVTLTRTMLEDSKHVMYLCAVKPIIEILGSLPTYGVIEYGVKFVKKQLSTLRTVEIFGKIFSEVQKMIGDLYLEELAKPRRKTLSITDEQDENQLSVEEFYRNNFFTAIDLAISTLNDFFNSADLKEYKKLENILITGVVDQKAIGKYPELCASALKIELRKYICKYKRHTVYEHMHLFSEMASNERCQFPTVEKLVKILVLSPASCCETTQSFPDAQSSKSWLHYSANTMNEPDHYRHHNPVSYVHWKMLKGFSNEDVATEFLNQVNF